MRFGRAGLSELFEYDKGAIVRWVSIPARDLRILGPLFSNSSIILGGLKSQPRLHPLVFLRFVCIYVDWFLNSPWWHQSSARIAFFSCV